MKRKFARIVIYMEISYTNTKMIGIADFVFDFIGNSDGFPMKQKGCALARVEDVALQPCSARKVFKPLMIEGMGELMWACPLCSINFVKKKIDFL